MQNLRTSSLDRNSLVLATRKFLSYVLFFYLRSVSYGAVGHVLGHELTHGFDTLGLYLVFIKYSLTIPSENRFNEG